MEEKKTETIMDIREAQLHRLEIAGIIMSDQEKQAYLAKPDDLGEYKEDMEIPDGYKKCGGCKHILKLYLFNVNNATKNKCTGNCKACQKKAAQASYKRTKHNRNYKNYYATHKEAKQEQGRKYYAEHKEDILNKQKDYHGSKKGKKVMHKAHAKRRKLMAENKGIPYEREWVIDRDKNGQEHPICYICGKPINFDRDIQLDHVVGITIGGKDCFTNVACTHTICNLQKRKDCREVSVSQVEEIISRAEDYMDEHPDLFDL